MFKPFRPPLLKKALLSVPDNDHSSTQPAKKRRLNGEVDNTGKDTTNSVPARKLVFKTPGISSLPRKPLHEVSNPAPPSEPLESETDGEDAYYNVLWRKYSGKKHKTWDGDGTLRVSGGYAYLQDVSGKHMGRAACSIPLLPESTLSIGGKEVEVDSMLSRKDYMATKLAVPSAIVEILPKTFDKPLAKPKPHSKTAIAAVKEEQKKLLNMAAPKSLASQSQWKNPMLSTTVMAKQEGALPTPRHDPTAPNAIVMKRPTSIPKGKEIVDVVVDPLLTKHLREHQRQGVKFLYECVMGMKGYDGEGAILADEMGLGKTLQTIALLWTLLKQNPIHEDPPIIKKALIVCPVTLINNWKKEFRKWLGNERIGVFVADGKNRTSDFTRGKSYNVMIIGYEKLRSVQEDLKKGAGVDIVICDEGHRLKTAKNKSAQAIRSLTTPRRIILSGTPIQNDLSEFFIMVDLLNPGLLGTFKSFTRQFEVPITKSRQPEATEKEKEKGEAASEELGERTSIFILRRTADILSKYLPSKTESVLLCRPTSTQASVYRHVLASPLFQSALGNSEATLQLITLLKKVCNSPRLLSANLNDPEKPMSPMTASLIDSIPAHLLRNPASSSKIRVLDHLLHTLRKSTSEKVVIVSNFTSTLDLLSSFLTANSLPWLRLDGTTPQSKRQDLVDSFNRTPSRDIFAFLLSAKAGGLGLNLIGASRLVLFDVDWNPAVDLQAMARIHRDGQKRPCVVYRLLMAGGIDEKVWQRQVTKLGLASSVMEQKGGSSSFTREDLRDLFRLDESEGCQTHKLIGCKCGGRGVPDGVAGEERGVSEGDGEARFENEEEEEEEEEFMDVPTLIKSSQVNMEEQEKKIREKAMTSSTEDAGLKMQSLMAYSHIDTTKFSTEDDEDMEALISDEVLLDVLKDEENRVSFVFSKTSG